MICMCEFVSCADFPFLMYVLWWFSVPPLFLVALVRDFIKFQYFLWTDMSITIYLLAWYFAISYLGFIVTWLLMFYPICMYAGNVGIGRLRWRDCGDSWSMLGCFVCCAQSWVWHVFFIFPNYISSILQIGYSLTQV